MQVFVNDIQLPFSGSLSLKYSNPTFNSVGSYSLPVSFPARYPQVQKAFGFPSLLDAEKLPSIPGMLRAAELELIGEWQVSSASEKSVEAYFKGNSSAFFGQIAGKYLHELNYNGITQPAGSNFVEDVLAYMTSLVDSIYPNSDYTSYCAFMPKAAGDETTEAYMFVNPMDPDTFGFSVPPSGLGDLNQGVYLFVGAVIDYIFREFGYKLTTNIFASDPDLCQLTLFNTFDQHGNGYFDYRNFVPRRLISDFLQMIAMRFNLIIAINETSKSVIVDYFDNVVNNIESTNLKLVGKKIDPRGPTGIKLVAEQPDEWAKTSNVSEYDFADDPATITQVATLRDIEPSAQGALFYVLNEANYYIINASNEAVRISPRQFPYLTGSNYTPKETAAGNPAMFTYRKTETVASISMERDWLLPRVDLKANGKNLFLQWMTQGVSGFNDYPIMLVFARGLVYNVPVDLANSSYGGNYPLGTIDRYNCEGDELDNSEIMMKLDWEGDYGLIERCWARRITWEMNTKKIVTADIIGSEIRKLFNFGRAVRIENSNYMVSSFTIEFSGTGYQVRDAELLRL